jgi:hypothetical protein
VAADRVWQKVQALAGCGIEALHLTSCLVNLCPFKDEFVTVIQRDFPTIKVVEGTHPFNDLKAVKEGVKELLSQRAATHQSMNDLIFKRMKISPGKKEWSLFENSCREKPESWSRPAASCIAPQTGLRQARCGMRSFGSGVCRGKRNSLDLPALV